MERVIGRAQHYAWGDRTRIPDLLGLAPDDRPWAEWWMGTHPLAPSTLEDGSLLSSRAGELPFLLKLMAAAQPLSLQAHPDAKRAAAGFAVEEAAGVAIDAPNRVYRDPHAKPELLCAIDEFDTLCGFRPIDDTVSLLHELDAHDLAVHLQHERLENTVRDLYRRRFATATTLAACRRHHDRREARLVNELEARYPGDPSVVVTLLLNRVLLGPGEAVFLGPGNLHAYLSGFGVEVMANSDNVIRGGLTPKHIDVDALLELLDYTPLADPVVRGTEEVPGQFRYETGDTPFRLWRFEVTAPMHHRAVGQELLLWTAGEFAGSCVHLAPGDGLTIGHPATVYCATVP